LLKRIKNQLVQKRERKEQKKIKAKLYIECSARDLNSVNEVFRSALKIVMDPLKEKKKTIAKLAKKEEEEEKKIEKKVEKERKKVEEKESKEKQKSGKEED